MHEIMYSASSAVDFCKGCVGVEEGRVMRGGVRAMFVLKNLICCRRSATNQLLNHEWTGSGGQVQLFSLERKGRQR